MSDNKQPSTMGRFQAFGASLRQSANDVAAKAAAQVAVVATSTASTVLPTATPTNQPSAEAAVPTTEASPVSAAPTIHTADASPPAVADRTDNTTVIAADVQSPVVAATEKKDLVELLQKMNKKVKALTIIRQQLTDQVESVSAEKKKLEALVTEEILNGVTVQADQDIVPQLQAAWRQQDEQNSLALQQIQKEFQNVQLQQQQQQNGDSQHWEKEKAELLQSHQSELSKLKQELATAASATASTATDGETTHNLEIQRIKDAAAAQLQDFKKKVAAARNAEITKVKADAAAAAKKIMEVKLTEQKEKWEQQLLDASKHLVDTAVTQSQPDIVRTEIEAAQTKALEIARLEAETSLNELRQKHATAMQTWQAEQQVTAEKQLNDAKGSLQSTVSALESQLASAQSTINELRENATKESESKTESAVALKNAEITKLKDETTVALETLRNELMAKFAAEKETVRSDFQQKWKDATAKNLAAAATQLQGAVQQVTAEYTTKLEQLRKELEADKTKELSLVRSESEIAVKKAFTSTEEANTSMAQAMQGRLESEVQNLKRQLDEQTGQFQTAQRREQSLQLELDEVKSRLASVSNGSDDVANAVADALALQRSSYEAIIETQKQQHFAALENSKTEIEALGESRDGALFNIIEVQNAAKATEASHEEKIATIAQGFSETISTLESDKQALEASVQELSRQLSELVASSENQMEELKRSMQQKDKIVLTEKTELVEGLQKSYVESEAARLKAEAALAEVSKKLESVGTVPIEQLEADFAVKIKAIEDKNVEALKKVQSGHDSVVKTIREEGAAGQATAIASMEEEQTKLVSQIEHMKQTFNEEKATLRKAMESHVDKMNTQFKEKLEATRIKASEETNSLQKAVQDKESKLMQLLERLKALTASSTKLRDENAAIKSKIEADVSVQKDLRTQLSAMKKQLDDNVSNNSSTIASLLQQQEILEKSKVAMENNMKRLQGELQSKSNTVEELNGKLQALSGNLNALTQDQKFKDGQLEQASKQEAKLQASEAEVTDLREQINKLKLEITKNATLVGKLQAEKDANERNHGQRTALVGMLEQQLSEMSDKNADINAKLEAAIYDVSQKDEVIQGNVETIDKMKRDLDDSKNDAVRSTEALAAAQKGADSKSNKMVEALQKELQTTKQQMARKSTAAQRLLQQRESECAELRKTNNALQHEVDKGSYSDRRILELAAKQSDRESYQVSEVEVRDSIIHRLKDALLERDGDLASAEKHAHEVESQIEELFRIRRREDVNIDYLKSIVVQYLSLPSGSTERARLLPVLATLLQFDNADYRTIEEGKNKVSWWDGSVIPKMIFAPSTGAVVAPAPSGSAEVSVTSTTPSASTTRTSLQF